MTIEKQFSFETNDNWPISKQGVVGSVFCKLYFHDPKLPVFITFGSMGMITTKDNVNDWNYNPWGFDFAIKLGLNVLSFSSYEVSKWYRCSVFHTWLEDNSEVLKVFPERLGYGGSMGGFAASAFSNILSIDRLLLLNPISTLKREIVPWEKRPFEQAADLHDWTGKYFDGAETKSDGWVVYDPIYNLDRLHAKRYPRLKKITVAGVGHQIPKHLNHFGLLKPLILNFINNTFEANDFYKSLKKRRNYINYYKWLESDQNTHKTPKRSETIKKYKNLFNNNVEHDNNSDLIEKVLSMALEIEDHDLIAYEVLEKMANNLNEFGFSALMKDDIEFIKMRALKYEKENPCLSLNLMRLALVLRPNGPFIARKVKEYELENKLNSTSVD